MALQHFGNVEAAFDLSALVDKSLTLDLPELIEIEPEKEPEQNRRIVVYIHRNIQPASEVETEHQYEYVTFGYVIDRYIEKKIYYV